MRLLVGSRPWQAACLQEEIVRLLVVNVGLALSDLVLRYGAELDGFQRSSFELDIGDTLSQLIGSSRYINVGGSWKMKFPKSKKMGRSR